MKIQENERIDEIPGTEFKIIQDKEKFSYGTDAIFLSEFVGNGKTAVDLGTGTGIIPIRMLGRKKFEKIYGIEIQKDMVEMADRSVSLNNLNHKIEIINMDLKNISEKFEKSSIDVVVSNPPYMKVGNGIINEDENLAISRHEVKSNIEDIIKSAEYLLKTLGKLYIVHRPDRLVDIFYYLREYRLEPKFIKFVRAKEDKSPNLVLIEAVKHGKPELKFYDDLIVYDNNGNYTEDIEKIYYGGAKYE